MSDYLINRGKFSLNGYQALKQLGIFFYKNKLTLTLRQALK